MLNILMPEAWQGLLQILDLLHGKLPRKGLKRHFLLSVNLVVVGLENMSLF